MKLHRLPTKKGERGFTLIELLIVIMIMGVVGAVVFEGVYQIYSVSARNTARQTALKQVEYAVRWITPDAQMALGDNVTGSLTESAGLSLSWIERNGTSQNVIYTIEDGDLERRHYQDGDLVSTKLVAKNIDTTQTSSSYSDGALDFTITSAIGGYRPQSVTRSFNVTLRSGTL